ncbi:3247_t:CDS:2, partial [Paraglomus occultum]
SKSPEECMQANIRMKEINQAYEVLSVEELRRRYDAGEIDFFSSQNNEQSKAMDEIHEEAKKFYAEMFKKALAVQRMLIRSRIRSKIDHKLSEIEIREDRSIEGFLDKSKINNFKEKMIKAIRERGAELAAGINNPELNKVRSEVIESIERLLADKNLKIEDLPEEHRNYREQINDLINV